MASLRRTRCFLNPFLVLCCQGLTIPGEDASKDHKKERVKNLATVAAMERTEWNPLISHMGYVRQDLKHPLSSQKKGGNSTEFSALSVPAWDCNKVASWIVHIGMGQYASVFVDFRVDGVRLLTLDSLQIERMGINNGQHCLFMESRIRELNSAKRLSVCQIEILPHTYYRSLNLGKEPPSRFVGELLHHCKP